MISDSTMFHLYLLLEGEAVCESVNVCVLLVKDRSVLQGFHGFSQHRADVAGLLGQSSAFIFMGRRTVRQEMQL